MLRTKPGESEGSSKRPTRVVFDIGSTPAIDIAFESDIVVISHGHVDHVGGIFSHARAHSVLFGGSTPTYYVPSSLVERLEDARKATAALDAMSDGRGKRSEPLLRMNIVGVNTGDEIELKQKKSHRGKKLFLRAFSVDHRGHPALGYSIASRTASGLKPEYNDMTGKQISELVKKGVQVKEEPIERLEVAYTGDTCAAGIMRSEPSFKAEDEMQRKGHDYLNQAFTAALLLCEATFLDLENTALARDRGHMNIGDVSSVLKSHRWDESSQKLVLYHLSGRYAPASKALDCILDGLSNDLADCCYVAISSLLSENERLKKHDLMDLVKPNGCISLKEYMKLRNDL